MTSATELKAGVNGVRGCTMILAMKYLHVTIDHRSSLSTVSTKYHYTSALTVT